MKVNVQLSSLEKLLNRGYQSLLEKQVKAALKDVPVSDFSLGKSSVTDVTISQVESLQKITVTRNQELVEEDLVQVTVPELYLAMELKVNGTKLSFASRAKVDASFKAVSSMAATWRVQLFFRQLKVKFYNSTVNGGSPAGYQEGIAKLQSAVGRSFGKYLSSHQKSLNEKLAQLEQQYFMGAYDLGLAYNYTLQPDFSEDGEEYSFNLHAMVHHSYRHVQGDAIRQHRIASAANPASFLSIPANNQNVTMRYLLSDRLLSSMFGAQYETPTALDQTMAPTVIGQFLKWLEVGLDLNMHVVDSLFDGVIDKHFRNKKRDAALAEKVGVSLAAADYPYFNLTADNTVTVISPVKMSFLNKTKGVLGVVQADMKMSFQLKHDVSRPTVLNVHRLALRVESISEFSNKVNPRSYSRADLQNVQRVANAGLYVWSKGIQKTMNLQGLEISQFLPSISVDQLSSQNRNMNVQKVSLLQLVKGHQQMKGHNAFVNTWVDLQKVKSSVTEVLSALEKYMFSE